MRANTPLSHVALAALVGFGSLGGLAIAVDSCHKAKGTQSEQTAQAENGAANVHQAQAKVSDAVAEDLKAKLEGQKADLGRLTKERDALFKRLAAHSKPSPSPVSGKPSPSTVCDDHLALIDDLQAVVAKDAEVIQSQNLLINSQSEAILVLTTSRDEWKATAEHREKQALAQAAATEAWKKAVTSSRWRGRGEGLLLGAAIGLLRGR